MGPLTPDQLESFQKNPRFIGMKFPEMNKPETLEKRYLGKLSRKALSFMKECLKMDPAQRLTSSAALEHPYFDGLRDKAELVPPKQEVRVESANKTSSMVPSNTNLGTNANLKVPTKQTLPATLTSQTNLNATTQKSLQKIAEAQSQAQSRHEPPSIEQ